MDNALRELRDFLVKLYWDNALGAFFGSIIALVVSLFLANLTEAYKFLNLPTENIPIYH